MLTPEELKAQRIKNLGTGMLGKKMSEETKEKIRKAMKGRKPLRITREAVAKSNKLRGCSKETREKMRQAKIGKSSGMLGKKVSQKTKNLISATLKEKALRGKNHPFWKGGKIIEDGYVYIKVSNHPYADRYGYMAEHRLMAEKALGRYLRLHEMVHHINEIRSDNRNSNFVICTKGYNRFLHGRINRRKKRLVKELPE